MDVAHPAGISATTNKGVKVHIYYGQGSLTGGLTAANFASQQVNGKLANGSHVATVGINAGTAVANRVTLNVYADQSIEGQSITLNDGTKVDILSGSNKNKAGEYVGQITPETVNVAVPVNVAATSSNSTTDTTTPSDKINAGEGSDSIFNADANMSVVINAVAARFNGNNVVRKSAINGSISATVDGKSVTALLHGGTNTTIYSDAALTKTVPATQLQSDTNYYADFNNVTLNLGNSYASKSEKFTLAKGHFTNVPAGAKVSKDGKTITVTVDNTGVARLGNVVVPFYAYDATNMRGIHFYAFKTGNEVQSGSVDLHAVNGKLNVESVWAAINTEYGAAQYINGEAEPVTTLNDFRDQLKKANIDVDANSYFTAPSSFNITLTARSNNNGAEATWPVTVNVDNATVSNNTNETTKNVTIMHIATIYDKNGKATNEPALRAYNSVSVVTDPVTIAGAKFYKLAGKDQYIKVGNVDGTSRSLRKNSYVYRSNGKAYMKSKKHHRVLKSGSSVTTYG